MKNVGRNDGTFEVYAECDPPAYMVGVTQTYMLRVGESRNVLMTIRGSSERRTEGKCIVKVNEINDLSIKDECYSSYTLNPIKTCTPGEQICSGKRIMECNEEGTGYTVTIKTCEEDCVEVKGRIECKDEVECVTDKDCKEEEDCVEGICIQKTCKNCFSWLGNILDIKECQPKPADKVMWIIPIPFTAQSDVCPIYLIVVFGIIALFVTLIIVLIRRYKK